MNEEDLKRLITQYEAFLTGGEVHFDNDDIYQVLKWALRTRLAMDEVVELIEECRE